MELSPGASIDFDSAPPSYGVRAVRLDFGGGSNLEITEPMQYVPVEPGHAYHFHAYMRTAEITTESGMRFSIVDPNHNNAVNALTENFTGLPSLDRHGCGRNNRPGYTLPAGSTAARRQPLV